MPYQSTVNFNTGFGVPGELYDSGPVRSQPFTLVSISAARNVFGRACSVVSEGVAEAGNPLGTNAFAGIIANPKSAASYGTSVATLDPTLTVPNGTIVDVVSMGSIIVALDGAAAIGDKVIYDNTTGILSAIAPGEALPSGKSFANAIVDRFTVSGAGLAVIKLTDAPTQPASA